jgi:hypothetical protein
LPQSRGRPAPPWDELSPPASPARTIHASPRPSIRSRNDLAPTSACRFERTATAGQGSATIQHNITTSPLFCHFESLCQPCPRHLRHAFCSRSRHRLGACGHPPAPEPPAPLAWSSAPAADMPPTPAPRAALTDLAAVEAGVATGDIDGVRGRGAKQVCSFLIVVDGILEMAVEAAGVRKRRPYPNHGVSWHVPIRSHSPHGEGGGAMTHTARTSQKSSSKKSQLTQRDCLRCDRAFDSEGPFNRLCKACQEYLNASPTPMEEYTIGYL